MLLTEKEISLLNAVNRWVGGHVGRVGDAGEHPVPTE
jgi:hypothetical protein